MGKKKSLFYDIVRRFKKSKTAMVALVILVIVILVAIFADVLVDYDEALKQSVKNRYLSPRPGYPLGTDLYGRSVLARMIHGARYSLLVGILVTSFTTIMATILGSCAGYFGGVVDNVIMRIMDVIISIPGILLMFCIVAVLGTGGKNLIIALSISSVPGFTRIIRSVILNLKGSDYIEASRCAGASDAYIIFHHIVPNALGPIIVQATMSISGSILAAASFSYIGLGFQAPMPEWGVMLSEAKDRLRDFPYLSIIPGCAIMLVSLCFNLMGDGLRDALDPRLKD